MIRKFFSLKLVLGAIFWTPLLFTSSCSKESDKISPLVSHGKAVYLSNCTACHNQDPNFQGSVGPEIITPSIELITARVLHQTYPLGYKPKRSSQLMPAMPYLEADILALHAYLNSFTKK
jgi:mono/diheme cytochrome c family protein